LARSKKYKFTPVNAAPIIAFSKRISSNMKNCILLYLVILSSLTTHAQLTATQIIAKMEQHLYSQSTEMEMDINIVKPNFNRQMHIKLWSAGQENAMVLVLSPDRDKGTVYLKNGKDVWYYVPSVKKHVKLPANMMMQNFMGSDMTNNSLLQEGSLSRDYTHKLLGETFVRGAACYKVELTPKPEVAVVWQKMIVEITKSDFVQVRAEFFDEDNTLTNIFEGYDIKTFGSKKMPSRMRFTPQQQKNQYTEVQYISVNFNPTLPEGFFSKQNMATLK